MSRLTKFSGASLAKSAASLGGNQFDKIIDKMGVQLLKGLETVSAEKQRAFKTGNFVEASVEEIIKKCAGENVKINAASNLVPGPSAMALMVPTQIKTIKNQMEMIFDIAKKNGAIPAKSKEFVLEVLAKGYMSEIEMPEMPAGKKKRSGKAQLKKQIASLTRGVYEKNMKKSFARWIPIGGPIMTAYWANVDTKKIGKLAEDYFSKT